MITPDKSRPQNRLLCRKDVELILLQSQTDSVERWLALADSSMTDEARDFLTDLFDWLRQALRTKKETVNA